MKVMHFHARDFISVAILAIYLGGIIVLGIFFKGLPEIVCGDMQIALEFVIEFFKGLKS